MHNGQKRNAKLQNYTILNDVLIIHKFTRDSLHSEVEYLWFGLRYAFVLGL